MSYRNEAIIVENISKAFHIYEQPYHRLLQMLLRGRRRYFREFWALKDISFSVAPGETVGIVGRNGSGKSTLLQIICGTLHQSRGSCKTNGRIAALLELGSGFNPEFTGRENVFLYSSILGVSRSETAEKFSDIASFADIGDFLDRPVKTYSSGMIVRLAFAVAINVRPQILVVDEALAVGDELFQRKCYAKIEQLKKCGVSILFVSHSASAVVSLCDRAILLDQGELLLSDSPKRIVGLYQRLLFAAPESRQKIRAEIKSGTAETPAPKQPSTPSIQSSNDSESMYDPTLVSKSIIEYEGRSAKIKHLMVTTIEGKPVNCLIRGERYRYSYSVAFLEPASNVSFGMLIKSKAGIELGGYKTESKQQPSIGYIPAGATYSVSFEFECNLNPGLFYLNAGVRGEVHGDFSYLHRVLDGLVFRVTPEIGDQSTGLTDFKISSALKILDNSKTSCNA